MATSTSSNGSSATSIWCSRSRPCATIERLQRKAKLFFVWPWFARQLLKLNPAFVNTIAVYLMPETIRAGAHVYLHTIMERRREAPARGD